MAMTQPTQRTPATQLRQSNQFEFVDTFDSQEQYYDEMQEEVELHMLRQGHGVRRSPRLYDER